MRFDGRVAIVTGASAGLGRAYCKALAREGAKVAAFARTVQKLETLKEEVEAAGGTLLSVPCDVSKEDQVQAGIRTVVETFGRIDILINNAQATGSNALPVKVEDTSNELVKLCWETGFFGTFLCTKYVLPYMKEQKYGRIVNTASTTGVKGMETFAAYGSQKEAIRCLTKVTAQEYGEYGITCNVICPGALTDASKLWKQYDPAGYEAAVAPQPIKRLGDPDTDIAPAVMFLVSDDARYVTAQTIFLDGGGMRF